ncbi:MAG: RDAC family protein [Coriobacteriales bacterium]|jgi:hypothetical protein
MVLDFHEYRKIKEALLEGGFREIHLHDVCGGQYFSIDDPDDATCDELVRRFAAMGQRVNFSETREEFTLDDEEPEVGGGAR